MKSLLLRMILLSCIFYGQNVFADPPDGKLDKELPSTSLDGVWILESYQNYDRELAGEELPELLLGHTRTFEKHLMTLVSKRGRQELPFTVNDDAIPKEFDVLINRDGERPGMHKAIFRIEGDVLQIAEGSASRPTSFEPTKEKQFSVYSYRRKTN